LGQHGVNYLAFTSKALMNKFNGYINNPKKMLNQKELIESFHSPT